MKKLLFLFILAFTTCNAQYRDFSNKNGVKISAKLVEANSETVKIELNNHKIYDIKIADLSSADIEYITNWRKWKFTVEISQDVDSYPKIPNTARTEDKMAGYLVVIKAIRTDKNGWHPYSIATVRGNKFEIYKKELETGPSILEKAGKEQGKGFKVELRKETLGTHDYSPSWFISWNRSEDYPRLYMGSVYDVMGLNLDETWRLIDFLKPYDAFKEIDKIERFKKSVQN